MSYKLHFLIKFQVYMEKMEKILTKEFILQNLSTFGAIIVIFTYSILLNRDFPCTCKPQTSDCWLYLILPCFLVFVLILWTQKAFQRICRKCYCCKFCDVWLHCVFKAFLTGLLWAAFVLLDGDLYVCCWNDHSEQQAPLACKKAENLTYEDRVTIAELKKKSRHIGISILALIVVLAVAMSWSAWSCLESCLKFCCFTRYCIKDGCSHNESEPNSGETRCCKWPNSNCCNKEERNCCNGENVECSHTESGPTSRETRCCKWPNSNCCNIEDRICCNTENVECSHTESEPNIRETRCCKWPNSNCCNSEETSCCKRNVSTCFRKNPPACCKIKNLENCCKTAKEIKTCCIKNKKNCCWYEKRCCKKDSSKCCNKISSRCCKSKNLFHQLMLEEEDNVIKDILRQSAKQELTKRVTDKICSKEWEECFNVAEELIETQTEPTLHEQQQNNQQQQNDQQRNEHSYEAKSFPKLSRGGDGHRSSVHMEKAKRGGQEKVKSSKKTRLRKTEDQGNSEEVETKPEPEPTLLIDIADWSPITEKEPKKEHSDMEEDYPSDKQ